MKTNKNRAQFWIIALLLIGLVITTNAQTNNNITTTQILKMNFQGTTNAEIEEFAIPDLLKIILLGGMSHVDTSQINGKLIDDSTLVYENANLKDTLNFWINYIKHGEVTDNWNILIDSATVRYSARGYLNTSLNKQALKQSAEEFLIHGLLPTSDEIIIDNIEVNSSMMQVYMNMRRALVSAIISTSPHLYTKIWDKFSELHIKKNDFGIMAGIGYVLIEAGLIDPYYGYWVGFRKQNNINSTSSKFIQTTTDSIGIEFIGNHQIKLFRDGEESIISYDNLKFLFP